MKNKFFAIIAVLLVAAFVMAACVPAATTTPEPVATEEVQPPAAEPTKAEAPAATEVPAPADEWADVDPSGQQILFWHQHTKDREAALLEIVDEFNTTNEWGITVTAEYQGSYGDIFTKMLPILNTPDVPDLVVAYQNQAATYQLTEGLLDLNSLVNSPKWGISEEDQMDFFPGFWAQDVFPNFDNARLALPPNRSMEVMYYNSDWLKELGYDAPPATPEEFKEMACKASTTPFSKATVEGSIGYELSVDASRFASWTFAFGGDVYDYEGNAFTYNSDAGVAAMTFLKDLFDSGCARQVTEAYGDQTDFGNGSLLFTVGSSSGLPFYAQAASEGANFAWSVAAIPHTTAEPVMNVYGASVSVPKTTPERELAAFLFLKYYTSADVQAKWAKVSQYFPVRASVADKMADYFAANPAYKTAFDMLAYSHFEPPVPGYDFVRDEIEATMAAIVDGGDVVSLLDAVNIKANEILADQLAQIK